MLRLAQICKSAGRVPCPVAYKYSILPSCHRFHQGISCIDIQTKALPYCCASDGVRELGDEIIDVSQVLTRVFQSFFELAQHRAYRAQPVQAVLLKQFQFVFDNLIDPTHRFRMINTYFNFNFKFTSVTHVHSNILASDNPFVFFLAIPWMESHIQA